MKRSTRREFCKSNEETKKGTVLYISLYEKGTLPLYFACFALTVMAVVLGGSVYAEGGQGVDRHYTFDTVINGGTHTPTTPNQFDARLSGQTLCEGVIGKALQFDADNQNILLGDLGLTAPATISVWLKRTHAPSDMRILGQLEGTERQAGALRLAGETLQVWDGRKWQVLANVSDKGKWQHVALVFAESGKLTCYLNGRLIRGIMCRLDFSGVPAGLGGAFLSKYGETFQGTMDDFRVYARALSESDIQAFYPEALYARAREAEVEQWIWDGVAVEVKHPPFRTGWNTKLMQQFIHPPVFTYEPIEGAAKYAFVVSCGSGKETLESTTPELDLADVWAKLSPVGELVVEASAVDAGGKVLAVSQSKGRRKPDFKEPYRPAKTGYDDSGAQAAMWLLKENPESTSDGHIAKKYIKQYPALFYASFIRLLTTYARVNPEGEMAEKALARARKYGRKLLNIRTPSNWAYANVPRSHFAYANVAHFDEDIKVWQVSRGAMMGLAFLDLYAATKENTWLKASVDIADALKKNQHPEGRWPWRVNPQTGAIVDDYTSDQAQAILLLDDLINKHGRKEYLEIRDKAVAWMLKNPCKTYRWEGQWDDAIVVSPFTNLEWYDTALFAEYLLRHATLKNGYEAIAKDLARYIEDQFVEWEPVGKMITPGVREQYLCYAIIDWHCAHYVRMCMSFHAATKDVLWLKKARAIADTLTAAQHPKGYYPTWMTHKPTDGAPTELRNINYRLAFPNCTSYTGEMLLRLGDYIQQGRCEKEE